MIRFERCMNAGYAARTKANADGADLTLAIYATFSTSGERLTRECALEAGKFYHGLNVARGPVDPVQVAAKLCIMPFETINFAGNGLYTMCKYGWMQEDCDAYAREVLAILARRPVRLVRSGGQTGFDEAGVKAAYYLGIDALVLAPKNWTYRTGDGLDHHDEKHSKLGSGLYSPVNNLHTKNYKGDIMTRKCEVCSRKMLGGQWQDQTPRLAAFHQFCQDEESACAIVEYKDGQVDVVPAGWVKFTEPERE